MRVLLMMLTFATLIAPVHAADCERVRGGLKVCTERVGPTVHIVTSREGDVVRYEAVIPADLKGADLAAALLPSATLLHGMTGDERGEFMLRVLATAATGKELFRSGYWWRAKRDGNSIRLVADRRE